MAKLFEEISLRGVTLRNRIAVSPMCEYSAVQGVPNDWHLVHLGSRAVGGAGLVFTEATAVEAAGRISPGDTGIYNEAQVDAWGRITKFVKEHGASPGIQLAHAGRKASTDIPWKGGKPLPETEGGWSPIAGPSPIAFADGYAIPSELSAGAIVQLVQAFQTAAGRALESGFEVVEIHGAHGYLLHEFLSPLSNQRTDEYGGSFENRTRIVREIVVAIRRTWPDRLPLFLRISATDYTDGGWTIDESVELARLVKPLGVDLIDCSSGGNVASAHIKVGPGYQVPFAAKIRKEAEVATGAVGMITEPAQAEAIIANGEADIVLLARELLRDPYWPRRAAKELGASIEAPVQYQRAW